MVVRTLVRWVHLGAHAAQETRKCAQPGRGRAGRATPGAAKARESQFRQSILAAAYKEAVEDDLGKGVVPLGDLLREPLKNGYSARPVSHETKFRVLTLTATTSGWFNPQHFKYTDEEFPANSPFWISPNDILVQRGNTAEYVGVPALYEGEPNQFVYPDLMIRVRVKHDISPRYLWYMLLAYQSRNFLRERATGSAGNMPKINQPTLREVPIPLATLERRAEIVVRLDKALLLATEIESRISAASVRVDRSMQAILAKAFRGALVSSCEDIVTLELS